MLTPKQVLQERKKLGIPDAGFGTPQQNQSSIDRIAQLRNLATQQKDTSPMGMLKTPNTFLGMQQGAQSLPAQASAFVGSKIQERGQRLGDTFAQPTNTQQDLTAKTTALIGEGAGLVFNDILGTLLNKGIHALPDAVKTPVHNAINKIADIATNNSTLREGLNVINEGIDAWKQYEKDKPLEAEQVRSAFNIISAVPIGEGTKVATTAVEDALAVGKNLATDLKGSVTRIGDTVAEKTAKLAPNAGKVIKDIIPTKNELISGQITKALDLTQGDVSNIKLSTKNDVGSWISDNNLIGGNKKETLTNVKNLTDTQYKAVRAEIAKVPTLYYPTEVPNVQKALSVLSEDLKGVLGQEKSYSEVSDLLKKKVYKLEDIQKVKEFVDNHFNLFKATGEKMAGIEKGGLANVRGELKNFIEGEVKKTTGADIAGLNNDVATGKSIQQLANKRSTRDFTRANISLSDLGFFGAGSALGSPLLGAAALIAKRIVETPTIQLKIAQWLKSLPEKEVNVIKNTLLEGKVPEQLNKVLALPSGEGKIPVSPTIHLYPPTTFEQKATIIGDNTRIKKIPVISTDSSVPISVTNIPKTLTERRVENALKQIKKKK